MATGDHPIQGGEEILLVGSCYRNQVSSGLMDHLARMQTLPLPQGANNLAEQEEIK